MNTNFPGSGIFGTILSFEDIFPSERIKSLEEKMIEKGIKAKDLEPIIGSKGHVSSVLPGRREITLNMASKLKEYFQLPADIFL